MTTTFKQLLKKVTNCSETNIPKWEGSGFAFFERFCANIWWCVTYHFQSDYLFFVTKAVKKMSRREVIFGKMWLTSMYIAFQIVLPGVCILVHSLMRFCILYSSSFKVAPYTRVFTSNPRYLAYVTERNLTCLVMVTHMHIRRGSEWGYFDNTTKLFIFWLCNMKQLNFRHFHTNSNKFFEIENFLQKEAKTAPQRPVLFQFSISKEFSAI